MSSDLRGKQEKKLVQDVYDENAALNNVRSLRDYEARAHRFERIASGLDDASAKKLLDKAELIRADVRSVTSRAVALVVRKRTERVVLSGWTLFAVIMFAGGAMAFAVSSDRLDSARDGEIKVAKECAEARTAKAIKVPPICGEADPDPSIAIALATSKVTLAKACADARDASAVEATLPTECGEEPDPPEEAAEPTAEELADKAFLGLAQAWLDCRAALRDSRGTETATCTRVERAMIASLGTGDR